MDGNLDVVDGGTENLALLGLGLLQDTLDQDNGLGVQVLSPVQHVF